MNLWHWLTDCENPVNKFGFWPVIVWYAALIAVGCAFFLLEIPGLPRWHGAVPLTWVVRCQPRWLYIALTLLAFWHFVLVTTKIK